MSFFIVSLPVSDAASERMTESMIDLLDGKGDKSECEVGEACHTTQYDHGGAVDISMVDCIGEKPF